MTILGPVLMAATIILPAFLADWSEATKKSVAVLDETGWFFEKFNDQENITFYYITDDLETGKNTAISQKGDLLLYIPRTELNVPVNAQLFSSKQPGLNVTAYIRNVMKTEVENKKLLASGIDPDIIKSTKVNINLATIRIEEDGIEKKSNTEVEVGLSIFAGIMIYFLIFMFGAQVLKGVMEEKQSRIESNNLFRKAIPVNAWENCWHCLSWINTILSLDHTDWCVFSCIPGWYFSGKCDGKFNAIRTVRSNY